MGPMDKNLCNLTPDALREVVAGLGGKAYLADYIFSFIQTGKADEISQITPLPKTLRQALTDAGFFIGRLKVVQTFPDPDGTVKFLFEAGDGCRIESVLLIDKDRHTVCVSSQAGCRMGCSFCATGQIKFRRNLKAGEIVDQIGQAAKTANARIDNVVYMGMGEPFDNYDEVMRSIRILNHPKGRNIGQRHITVSTCGIPEGIERFAGEDLQVRLALSLHAPADDLRRRLMGIADKYPMKDIFAALRRYQRATNRRVTIEYCLINDVNDADHHARSLVRLLKPLDAAVNLIEYNPHDGASFEPSSRNRVRQFCDILKDGGIETVVRHKRGQSIKGACGQLGATSGQPQ